MTRAVRPRTLRRIASRERQRGYLGLNSYRRLAASALSGPAFAAGLLTSIVPDKAAPGTAPTFTRATTKTFTDWEGQVRTALAGEACFTGARRVQNTVAGSSFDLSNAAYVKRNGHAAAAPDATGLSLITVTAGITGGNQGVFNESLFPAGIAPGTYVFRARAIAGSLSQVAIFIKDRATDTVRASATVNIAAGVGSVVSVLATGITTLGARVEVNCAAGGSNGTLWLGEWQVECVNGQSNQNPSEYVSVGVLAAPYQGANVDGVQYFATQNGNTVAANVVTSGTGAVIASSLLLGYSAWQAATNLALQSEDLTTTWVVTACTVGANAVVGPDGNTTADKVQEDATTAAHFVKQSITKAASALVYTLSVYLKQAERTWANVQAIDTASNGAQAWFNLATGSVGTTGSFGTTPFTAVSATITPSANGFYRCTLTFTTTTDTLVQPRVATATADNVISFAGTVNSGIYAWGAQLEQNAFATPYIATTTAAVTRNADVLTYPTSGNMDGTKGSAYCEATWVTQTSGTDLISAFTPTSGIPMNMSSAAIHMNDGVDRAVGPAIPVSTPSIQKLATKWGASACNGFANGVAGAGTAFDGDLNIGASLGLLVRPNNTSWPNGNIRNVKIWNRALTDAELVQATS